MRRIILFLILTIGFCSRTVFAEMQDFRLAAEDSRLSFEVDSTLHAVRGLAEGIEGTLRFNPETFESVMPIVIRIPAAMLDTRSAKRDKAMRKMLQAGQFPYIIWEVTSVDCVQARASGELLCHAGGDLTIAGVTRRAEMVISAVLQENGLHSRGEWRFRREDFSLETPSVLGVIRVDQEIRVAFEAVWRPVPS